MKVIKLKLQKNGKFVALNQKSTKDKILDFISNWHFIIGMAVGGLLCLTGIMLGMLAAGNI